MGAGSLGLVSSFHCMGMCGPILCGFNIKGKNLFLYHLGKFSSYLVLALVIHFSTFAFLLNFKEELKLYIFLALIFSYLLILGSMFFKKSHGLGFRDKIYQKFFIKISQSKSAFLKPLGIGLLSGFLPCAILYSFLLSVAMVEKVEVLTLSVLAFSGGTAIGLLVFQTVFNLIIKKFPRYKNILTISVIIFSIMIIIHRYLNFEVGGLCSNAL